MRKISSLDRVRKLYNTSLLVVALSNTILLLLMSFTAGVSSYLKYGIIFMVICFPFFLLFFLNFLFKNQLKLFKRIFIYLAIVAICLGSGLAGGLRSIGLFVLIVVPFFTFALEEPIIPSSIAALAGYAVFLGFWYIPGGDDFIRHMCLFDLDDPSILYINPNVAYVFFFNSVFLLVFIFTYFFSRQFNAYKRIIEEKNKELELLNEEKSLFFMNLSHEIKTPVSIIKNCSEEIIKRAGENEYTLMLKHNALKLSRDILNYMHIEKMTFTGKPLYEHNQITNLSAILKEIICLYRQQNIKTEITGSLYSKISADAFDKLINNLISNAIKYNEKDVLVTITLEKVSDRIKLTVSDNGIGIPHDKQKHLFEPFYQVSHKKENIQGVGLGLSIVKAIVDSVKGNLEVKSEINRGTSFIIMLESCDGPGDSEVTDKLESAVPLLVQEHNLIKEESYRSDLDTILIAEDNPDMLTFLIESFKDEYNVYHTVNGQEAIDKLEAIYPYYLPKVIISDVMMDTLDGFGFFQAIRSDSRFSYIPFIFLTARTDRMEKVNTLEEGAVDYITKPFDIRELKAKVKSNIASREKLLDDFDQIKDWEEDFKKTCNEYNFSPRESEIIKLWIFKDYTQQMIAEEIGITRRTVERNIRTIKEKTSVESDSWGKKDLKKLFNHLL